MLDQMPVDVTSSGTMVALDRSKGSGLSEKVIRGRDFTCVAETVNAVEVMAQPAEPCLRHCPPPPHVAALRDVGWT
jgi:hypothetical protein